MSTKDDDLHVDTEHLPWHTKDAQKNSDTILSNVSVFVTLFLMHICFYSRGSKCNM